MSCKALKCSFLEHAAHLHTFQSWQVAELELQLGLARKQADSEPQPEAALITNALTAMQTLSPQLFLHR